MGNQITPQNQADIQRQLTPVPASTPMYQPPQAGGTTATVPVVTASDAQNDYNSKQDAFKTISQQIAAHGAANISKNQLDAFTKAQNDMQASQQKLEQQKVDIQGKTADTAASLAASKAAAVNGLTGMQTPTPETPAQPIQQPKQNSPNQATTNLNNEQAQQQQIQKQKDQNVSNQQSLLASVLAGTIPLSSSQQAIITSLQAQLKDNEARQKQANDSQVGAAREAAFRSGAEYSPQETANSLANVISQGVTRIQELDNSAASTVAKLEQDFQKGNFDIINKSYDILTKQLDDKSNAIKTMYDQTTKVLQDQRTYEMDVAKFNQTKDQNAFDRAFKKEQQKFEEKYKTATLNKDVAAQSETARHNKAVEAIDRFKSGQGVGGSGIGNNIPSAQMGANNTVDPVSQKQTLANIAQTYGPMTSIAIKGLADYSMNPADWKAGAAKGMSRADAVTLAKMVDPTYDDKMYPTRASYLKNLTSGSMAQGVVAANKSINHLIAFTDSIAKLPNDSSFSHVNALNNFVNSHNPFDSTTQQTVKTAQIEANGLKDELAKFFKGTGSSDVKSIDDWSQGLDVNASQQNQHGLIQGAVNLLAGQLDVMNQQYTSTMGKAPEGSILQPQTAQKLSELKNKGYEVNIPGVYYTDKSAYLKNGGNEESLSKSYTILKNAGIPTTPENILQAAQI